MLPTFLSDRMDFVVALVVVAAGLAWRWFHLRTIDRQLSARLPLDASGIIVGAEPITLDAPGDAAVLLIHGGGDTPQTLHYLATALHERGYSVRAPLLPGHGRRLPDLARATADQWSNAVVEEYTALQRRHSRCYVVGFSLGGALATPLAANTPSIPALVLIAPYLAVPRAVAVLARWAPIWGIVLPYLRVADAGSVQDPTERVFNRAFGILPARAFAAIRTTSERAANALPRVKTPTLIMQSRHDNRVSIEVCRHAFAALGAPDKRLELLDQGGHIVTVDYGRERVIGLTIEWIEAHRPGTR